MLERTDRQRDTTTALPCLFLQRPPPKGDSANGAGD